MIFYPLALKNPKDLAALLRRVGADLRSLAYFEPKRHTLALMLPEADYRAAAFLKQELLARGGDAVVNRGVIACEAKTSPVLLLGTPGQLRALRKKLDAMDCWGLKEIRRALSEALDGLGRTSWTLPLSGGRSLSLGETTGMMAILNLTPDSFYWGSRIDPASEKTLLEKAGSFLAAGAAVLDLGGESTRPASEPISEEEEAARLIPALRAVRRAFPEAVLSADTWKASLARKAVEAGADIINDISGLAFDPALMKAAAETGALLVLSHIQGRPADMQKNPVYKNTVEDILTYFDERLAAAEDGGISRERIILDPGLGFGKGYGDNLKILRHIGAFRIFGRPLLVGHSRKGFTGRGSGTEGADERLEGTLAVTAWCAFAGVSLVRVHDLEENRRVLAMIEAISGMGE